MKTFIIIVETAILAFIFGGAYGKDLAEKEAKNKNPSNDEVSAEESPA